MLVIDSEGTTMLKFRSAYVTNNELFIKGANEIFICESFEDHTKARDALWYLFKEAKDGAKFVDMSDFI